MKNKKRIAGLVLAAVMAASAVSAHAAGDCAVSGNVTCAGKEQSKVTLSLLFKGGAQAFRIVKLTGNRGSFAMEDLDMGLYTLRAEKAGHVTREYPLVVTGGTVTQDVKLQLLGDVNGDGRTNTGDVARIYAHARRSTKIEDTYQLQCADFNSDGKVNVGDAAKVYNEAKNPTPEPVIPALPANPVEDNKDTPIEIGSTLTFDATVAAGHLSHYALYRISETSLIIRDPYAFAVYNGVTYEAEDGVLTVPGLHSDNTNTPVYIAIGNRATQERTFGVCLEYPLGHRMSPLPLNVGMLSTYCVAGNSQGVYYTYTTENAGKLTLRLSQAVDCNITITSTAVEGGTRSVSLSESESTSVTYEMYAGETVSVCVVVNPVNGFNYPEAIVSSTVTFR